MRFNTKRATAAVLGAGLFGAVVASATTLGGLSSDQLGANETTVAACDADGVSISYTHSYDATAGEYTVDTATVDGIDEACLTQALSLTIKGAGGAALFETSSPTVVDATSETITVTGTVLAESVTGAAVVIATA
jgi:hypothetical protein